jgi:hypothetical protein
MISRRKPGFSYAGMVIFASMGLSCSTSNPNTDRVLISIAVTPETANATDFANGQVTFTATGTFNQPPINAPMTFTAPYTGSFTVDNPSDQTIANVVSSGTGTLTVVCANGASGTVAVVASATANNNTGLSLTGSSQLTCP